MKKVSIVPPPEYKAARDPWLDDLFDGNQWHLEQSDWKPRYNSPRSAASAIHQAARKRGFPAIVNIRGEDLYVQAVLNGQAATKVKAAPKVPTAKAAPAKRVGKVTGKTPVKTARKRSTAAA